MLHFIFRRLLLLIPILFTVSVLVFLILRLGPNDPALSYLRLSQIPPTDEALATAREFLGLNKPLLVQYLDWAGRALRLDFGLSYVTHRPVLAEILYYLPATLELAGVSLLLTLLVSIPLGMWSALNKDCWPDHMTRAFAFFGVSMPNFWMGFLLVTVFSVWLHWLPPMGRGGISHLIMPAVSLALMSISINIRLIRASMLENLHTRSVLYARARGLRERTVIGVHVFKNSLIPVITAIGMHVGELLGGAVVVESIFSWPGVGRFAVSSIYNRDYPVMQCFLLLMVVIFVLCNLLVDICYAAIDPRIRLAGEGNR
ncbi:nickel ABC transporter permease subunit NikB [Desulfogranum japonicum]|uniref:nickel ABC transporter permease subunit NikB n=1 Tax=Desulfogranum japonicum TaxID=231447 RepID=UPI0004174D64|nr:nickel ABC transporter permease subunit NikB [Desulfogranum japonicum]